MNHTIEKLRELGYEVDENSFLPNSQKVSNEAEKANALTEMITSMSTATTLAQMRKACKDFLERTE